MNELHELAARVGLAATGRFGFALAGGYAVQAHGFLERSSEDVDLFTVAEAESHFDEAVNAAVEAYRAAGLTVELLRQNPAFARLLLTNSQGGQVRVELGVDWRAHPPVTLEIGAVLHQDDAVANKLCVLYGRAADRDYVDRGCGVAQRSLQQRIFIALGAGSGSWVRSSDVRPGVAGRSSRAGPSIRISWTDASTGCRAS